MDASSDPMNTTIRRTAMLAAACSVLGSSILMAPMAKADPMSATIGKLGKVCKQRVVDQFDVPNSDAYVSLGATLQQSIDAGDTKMADVKRGGLSFNWEIRGKRINGYCNIKYNGTIEEFKQSI